MIKHDEGWLSKIWSTRTTDDYNCGPDDCRAYFKHMTRWRTMDEPPLDGQMILIKWNHNQSIHVEKVGKLLSRLNPDSFMWTPIHAPLGELPEVSDVA